jgi:uncharacterized protein with NRDE domain
MCTVVLLRRPGHRWPLLLAANRDEMADRPWRPPARHWPDRAEVVAGLDDLAGGTWMGLNDDGVVAAILNRQGTLGPKDGKRTRGELVLEALDHADAAAAAEALADLDGRAYRPFNMVVADNRDAFWLRHTGREDGRVEAHAIPEGLSMITAFDLNDGSDPRIHVHRERFASAPAPRPETGDWAAWERLLASHETGAGWPGGSLEDGRTAGAERRGAMCFITARGFGTVCASLLALPAVDGPAARPVWRFAPGPPDTTVFDDVALEAPGEVPRG